MKKVNYTMLGFAFTTALFIILIGFSIGAGSFFGVILSIIGVTLTMGFGFTTKKKLREQGKL